MTLVFYALLLRSLWSYLNATNVPPLLFQRKPLSHALSPGIVAAATATSSLEQQLPPPLRRLHRTGRRDGALRLVSEMVFEHGRITAPPALVFAVNRAEGLGAAPAHKEPSHVSVRWHSMGFASSMGVDGARSLRRH